MKIRFKYQSLCNISHIATSNPNFF